MSESETPRQGGILREFLAYLRHPRAIAPSGLRAPGALRQVLLLTLLDVAVLMVLLLPLIAYWQDRFDLPSPDAFGEIPPAMLVPVAVLIAPVLEEILFRGWLTGRVRALWLLACAIGCAVLLYASTQGLNPAAAGLGLIALAVAALAGWLVLRKRGVPRWFAPGFTPIFYLAAAGFGLAHMVNYPAFSLIALPMVLPQLWSGLMLGFVRMRIGLPASMLLHGAANGAVVALATLAG